MDDHLYGEAYAWGLTVSAKGGRDQVEAAMRLAERYQVPYLHRESYSQQELRSMHHLDVVVTLDRNMRLFVEEPALHWHPALALTRLRRLAEGRQDVFLSAVSLREGDSFLDCTLGFGVDMILAAQAIGESGEALGLEASPVIALLTEWGLANEAPDYNRKKAPLETIARRIQVLAGEASGFLKTQPDNRWDVVYFDPMFQVAQQKSSGINSIRPLACYKPFIEGTLAEALRVCSKRVVLKERWFSPLFQQLGADRMIKTKYGPVAYGVWDKGAGEEGAA